MPDLFSFRALNAAMPDRLHQTSDRSMPRARLMLTALQMLPRLRRRKSNRVTQIINALADSVDPAETERLVHRFGPGHTRLPRVFLMIADPQFLPGRMILLQPPAKIAW